MVRVVQFTFQEINQKNKIHFWVHTFCFRQHKINQVKQQSKEQKTLIYLNTGYFKEFDYYIMSNNFTNNAIS